MRPLLLLGWVLLAACGPEAVHLPRPEAIQPTQGANDVDVPVEISGANFEARVRADFDAPQNSLASRAFEVSLVPVEEGLPRVELAQVELSETATLRAVVPAGASRGFYGVEVRDAFGRVGFVPEVYRVVSSPSRVVSFRFDSVGPQRAGVPFTVQLWAVDSQGRTVDGFVGSVAISDRTGTVTPASVGPFALGRARAQLMVKEFAADDVLTAVDGEGRSGSSEAFAVKADSVVKLAYLSTPQALDAGACSAKVLLEAEDSFGRTANVEAELEARLTAAPPDGVTFYSDADCALPISTGKIPPGTSRLGFHYRGEVAGRFTLRVVPTFFPSAGQEQTVRPLPASQLGFVTPPRSVAPGACSEALTVKSLDRYGNDSPPADSVTVALSVLPAGQLTLHLDPSCATGAVLSAVLPAGSPAITFYAQGVKPGAASVVAAPAPPSTLSAATQPATVTP